MTSNERPNAVAQQPKVRNTYGKLVDAGRHKCCQCKTEKDAQDMALTGDVKLCISCHSRM